MELSPAIAALRPKLMDGLAALSLPQDESRVGRWLGYLELLAKWNQAYNLTAVRDPAEMLTRHLLDSLAMAPLWTANELADMGAGAGLPGLPLAILHPERRVVLIESNGKKCRFMREVKRTLGLDGVEVVEARAEAYRPPAPLAAATARAVAPIGELAGWCHDWLAPGGRLLAMKGPGHAEELGTIPPGYALVAIHPLIVPGLDGERVVVELRRD